MCSEDTFELWEMHDINAILSVAHNTCYQQASKLNMSKQKEMSEKGNLENLLWRRFF